MVAAREIKKNCCDRALRGIGKVRVWPPRKKSKRIAVIEPLEVSLRAQKRQKASETAEGFQKRQKAF